MLVYLMNESSAAFLAQRARISWFGRGGRHAPSLTVAARWPAWRLHSGCCCHQRAKSRGSMSAVGAAQFFRQYQAYWIKWQCNERKFLCLGSNALLPSLGGLLRRSQASLMTVKK